MSVSRKNAGAEKQCIHIHIGTENNQGCKCTVYLATLQCCKCIVAIHCKSTGFMIHDNTHSYQTGKNAGCGTLFPTGSMIDALNRSPRVLGPHKDGPNHPRMFHENCHRTPIEAPKNRLVFEDRFPPWFAMA